MLRRVIFEHWQATLGVVLLLLTSGVFAFIVVRTLRMKTDRADRLARMPLDGEAGDAGPKAGGPDGG